MRPYLLARAPALMFLIAVALCSGCSTTRDLVRIDELTPAEFARLESRLALQVEAVASAAIDDGDMSREAALLVSESLAALAAGSAAPGLGVLGDVLDLEGWGALALTLVVVEVDAELERLGAYGEGWERGRLVLAAVAEGLERAAGVGS